MHAEKVDVIKYDIDDVVGTFYGQYKPEEVDHLLESGVARLSYNHGAGFLGLAMIVRARARDL